MSDKPVYPFAQGQIFENLNYRCSNYSADTATIERRNFIKDVLDLRSAKYFFVDNSIDSLTLCDRPYSCGNSYKKRFRPNFCGYPIHPKITEKIFNQTKPAGHWFGPYDQGLINVLREFPFIPFKITKSTKSLNSTNLTIPKGDYISIGKVAGTAENRALTTQSYGPTSYFSAVEIDGKNQKIFDIYDARFQYDCFSALNVFVPSRAFSNHQNVGLTLLSNGSIVWLWHDSKWKTCKVSTVPYADGVTSSTAFIELDLNSNGTVKKLECLLEIVGHELKIHKTIAKLIEQDDLRIAIRSMTQIIRNSNLVHSRAHIVKTLANNYGSEFLEPYKMQLLRSTDYKNMSCFNDFALAMAKKFPPLTAHVLSKTHMDSVAEYAVLAAKNGTPFLWGVTEALKSPLLETLKHAITAAGFDMEPMEHYSMKVYSLYHFGLQAKEIKHEQRKTVKVSFSAKVSKTVTETYKVQSPEDLEFQIPDFIYMKGDAAIKSFVKEHFDTLESEYNIRDYKKVENSTQYTKGSTMVPKIKFMVDSPTITIK